MVLAIWGHRGIGLSGYWGWQGLRAMLAELGELGELGGWRDMRLGAGAGGESSPGYGYIPVLMSRSYCQWRLSCQVGVMLLAAYQVARQGRGSGFTIGRDDGVAIMISLFDPGRVRGLGRGKSMDTGD